MYILCYLCSIAETKLNQELLVKGKVDEGMPADLEILKEKGN